MVNLIKMYKQKSIPFIRHLQSFSLHYLKQRVPQGRNNCCC